MISRSASLSRKDGDSDGRGEKKHRKPKEGFVLDNSIVMAWSFEDETDEYADAVLDRLAIAPAVIPALWPNISKIKFWKYS